MIHGNTIQSRAHSSCVIIVVTVLPTHVTPYRRGRRRTERAIAVRRSDTVTRPRLSAPVIGPDLQVALPYTTARTLPIGDDCRYWSGAALLRRRPSDNEVTHSVSAVGTQRDTVRHYPIRALALYSCCDYMSELRFHSLRNTLFRNREISSTVTLSITADPGRRRQLFLANSGTWAAIRRFPGGLAAAPGGETSFLWSTSP